MAVVNINFSKYIGKFSPNNIMSLHSDYNDEIDISQKINTSLRIVRIVDLSRGKKISNYTELLT